MSSCASQTFFAFIYKLQKCTSRQVYTHAIAFIRNGTQGCLPAEIKKTTKLVYLNIHHGHKTFCNFLLYDTKMTRARIKLFMEENIVEDISRHLMLNIKDK